MIRRALIKSGGVLAVIAVPLTAAAIFAGGASAAPVSAAPSVAQPVSHTIPLEPITTNPHATYHDPVANGAVLGAGIGSATGSFVDPWTTLLGAAIGGGVGYFDPNVIPQVLP